jgi:hypothetical protein
MSPFLIVVLTYAAILNVSAIIIFSIVISSLKRDNRRLRQEISELEAFDYGAVRLRGPDNTNFRRID